MKNDHKKAETYLQRGKVQQPLALDLHAQQVVTMFPTMFSGRLEEMTGEAASPRGSAKGEESCF